MSLIRNDLPVRIWQGTIVLRCPPCSWGKCIFCGYSKDCVDQDRPSTEDFLSQLNYYFGRYSTPTHLEVYNSGSFLDDNQIQPESRVAIFEALSSERVRSVAIESRPEYIAHDTLAPLIKKFKGDLAVCIGLEIADDSILRNLRKGFSLNNVENALRVLKGLGISSRAYILAGAPFTENPGNLTLNSVKYAQKLGFDEVSILGAYPMKGSYGHRLWKRGQWSPLKVEEFDDIIAVAKKIKPDLDSSCEGLKRFW